MKTAAAPPPEADDDGRDPPVKVIDRAARLLRTLAAHSRNGATFTEVMDQMQLGKSTTHRLLSALVDTGFVFQDIGSRRYRLGSAVAMLAAGALAQSRVAACQPSLRLLADVTEDTVFAQVAEGTAAVCIGRATGTFPIRTLTLDEGDRRPLGVGAGSLALLSAMPDATIARLLERNARWLQQFPSHTPAVIRQLVEATRRDGFSFNTGRIVPGMLAVGVAVRDGSGQVLASLSVAAITERMSGPRVREIVGLLHKEAAALAARLQEDADA